MHMCAHTYIYTYIWKEYRFWSQIDALPLMSCMTLGKFLNLTKFQFLVCKKPLIILTPRNSCEDYSILVGKNSFEIDLGLNSGS